MYTTVSKFLERCLDEPLVPEEEVGDITYEYKKGHLVASFREREDDEVTIRDKEDNEKISRRSEREQGLTNQNDESL